MYSFILVAKRNQGERKWRGITTTITDTTITGITITDITTTITIITITTGITTDKINIPKAKKFRIIAEWVMR